MRLRARGLRPARPGRPGSFQPAGEVERGKIDAPGSVRNSVFGPPWPGLFEPTVLGHCSSSVRSHEIEDPPGAVPVSRANPCHGFLQNLPLLAKLAILPAKTAQLLTLGARQTVLATTCIAVRLTDPCCAPPARSTRTREPAPRACDLPAPRRRAHHLAPVLRRMGGHLSAIGTPPLHNGQGSTKARQLHFLPGRRAVQRRTPPRRAGDRARRATRRRRLHRARRTGARSRRPLCAPGGPASLSSRAGSRAASCNAQPSSASACAMARPMSEVAPITSAVSAPPFTVRPSRHPPARQPRSCPPTSCPRRGRIGPS